MSHMTWMYPIPAYVKTKDKINGDTKDGLSKLSDEFSPSHKSRWKDIPNGDVEEYEKNQNFCS